MMKKKISFWVLFGMLLLPLTAGAQTIAGMVDNIVVNVAWPVAIGAVIIFWLATGILFVSALGSPEKIGLAKKALIASVAGTIVIVLAASAIAIIRNTLGI